MPTTRAQQSEPERSRILIVDDERGPRESLRMILAPRYAVDVAESATVALEMLRAARYQLATVDLNMPGMQGDELMRTIRDEFPQIAVIVITGCASAETAVEGLRCGISDYLTKPFDVVQVSASVSRALTRQESRKRVTEFLEAIGSVLGKDRDVSEVVAELGDDAALERRLRSVIEEPALEPGAASSRLTAEGTTEFLEVLADTIERRDPFLRGHGRRVAYYGALLADEMGLCDEEKEQLRLASFLHDLGKVAVAADVIQSESPFTEAERAAMTVHPKVGEELVRPLGFSAAVSSSIRHHHERWDGAGYPDGLAGAAIPLGARVISIVDAFDAMTTARPDRAARDDAAAARELTKEAGAQFDPVLVERFVRLVEREGTLSEETRAAEREASAR